MRKYLIFLLLGIAFCGIYDYDRSACESHGYAWVPGKPVWNETYSYSTSSSYYNLTPVYWSLAGELYAPVENNSLVYGIHVVDYDGDGDDDIVGGRGHYELVLWKNNGNGTFIDYVLNSTTYGAFKKIKTAEINNDTYLDVIGLKEMAPYSLTTILSWVEGGSNIIHNISTASFYSLDVGDINNDSYTDIVVTTGTYDDNIYIFKNDGLGNFTEENYYVYKSGGVALGDINGDGYLDIVVSGSANITWFENNGTGYFTPRVVEDFSTGGGDVAVGDLDGDGDNDIVFTSFSYSGNITWFENDGLGNFTKHQIIAGHGGASPYIIDVDRDGDNDILLIIFGYSVDVGWLENSNLVFDTLRGINLYDLQYIKLAYGDFNSNGDIDVLVTDNPSSSEPFLKWYPARAYDNRYPRHSPACCGDDGLNDNFAQIGYDFVPLVCDQGKIEGDNYEPHCTNYENVWLTGDINGSQGPCCGDDYNEYFYNSTNNYGGFCINSTYYFGDADGSQGACELLGYTWLSGAVGNYSSCCGDDGALDDFGDQSSTCCCNGVVIQSGEACDLDQDGIVESVCENGKFPPVFISYSNYENSYVENSYVQEFYIKNTGSSSIEILNASILNISLKYYPDKENPVVIPAGSTGVLKYYFGEFTCQDFGKTFYPIVNITYKEGDSVETIIRYLSFFVSSPLDIKSTTPSIDKSIVAPLNRATNVLITLSNNGDSQINYNVSLNSSSDVMLFLEYNGKSYSSVELRNKIFTIQPKSSVIYKLKIIPSSIGEKKINLSFVSVDGCENITDFIQIKAVGYSKSSTTITEVSSWDWIVSLLFIIIPLFILYHKLKKEH